MSSNEERIVRLETVIENINATLLRIDKRFDHLESDMKERFNSVDEKFKSLESEMKNGFKDINNRLWSNFLWLMGMIIGLAGLIAHTQHWF